MRSMVEGFLEARRTPPPHFVRSPSPRNRGEDLTSARVHQDDLGVLDRLDRQPLLARDRDSVAGLGAAAVDLDRSADGDEDLDRLS